MHFRGPTKAARCPVAIACATAWRICACAAPSKRSTRILHGVDGGTPTAPEAIEQLLSAQVQLHNRRLQAAMRSSRLPAVKHLHDFAFTFQP